jgi:hypothetical protein
MGNPEFILQIGFLLSLLVDDGLRRRHSGGVEECAFCAPRRAERTCAFHIEWLDRESFSITGKLNGATAEGTEEDGNAMGEIEEEWGFDYHVKEAGTWCLLRLTVRVNIGWE